MGVDRLPSVHFLWVGESSVRGLMLRRFAAVGLAVGLVIGFAPADVFASSPNNYDQLQQQISRTRARIREARQREKRIMAELARSDARRMSLERSLATVSDQ